MQPRSASSSRAAALLVTLTTATIATVAALWNIPSAEAEPPPTYSGDPMVLRFVAAVGADNPFVFLGEETADSGETVRVKVDWGFEIDDEGGVGQRASFYLTEPGLYFGGGIDFLGTTIRFPTPGEYTVTIYPLLEDDDPAGSDTGPWLTLFGAFRGSDERPPDDFYTSRSAAQLVEVISFGDLGITALSNAFARNESLVAVPSTIPSTVTDLVATFAGAGAFDAAGVSDWDVSNVTRMKSLFRSTPFSQPIGNWERADSTVGNVTDMANMFEDATAFNQPIGNWDVSSVTDMSDMFEDATSFNQPIGNWERAGSTVGNVTDMANMFEGATSFNQPIGNWDVSSVTDMSDMFKSATSFNQPIRDWDVANVTRMDDMFEDATAFDQPLEGWDVSNVTRMEDMFRNAASFDQSLSSWTFSNALSAVFGTSLSRMFDGSGMSSSCYDATLVGWAAYASDADIREGDLGASGVRYSPIGETARRVLIDELDWEIYDGGLVDVATGRCATPVASTPAPSPTVTCVPATLQPGTEVTCEVSGGDPDIDILWRATVGAATIGSQGVRIDAGGKGTFRFTIPLGAVGQTVTVELVDWTAPIVLGVVGGPVPRAVPAGDATSLDRNLLLAGALAAIAAAASLRRRRAEG